MVPKSVLLYKRTCSLNHRGLCKSTEIKVLWFFQGAREAHPFFKRIWAMKKNQHLWDLVWQSEQHFRVWDINPAKHLLLGELRGRKAFPLTRTHAVEIACLSRNTRPRLLVLNWKVVFLLLKFQVPSAKMSSEKGDCPGFWKSSRHENMLLLKFLVARHNSYHLPLTTDNRSSPWHCGVLPMWGDPSSRKGPKSVPQTHRVS